MVILIHTIIYIGYSITKQQQIDLLVAKYMKTLFKIHKPPRKNSEQLQDNRFEISHRKSPLRPLLLKKNELNELLLDFDLEVSKISYKVLQQEAQLIGSQEEWELFNYKGHRYFYDKHPFHPILIKDNTVVTDKTKYIILLTLLLNIVLISFYIFLVKRLKPLKKLKESIADFAKGDLEINTTRDGKDEISDLSNEFNNAIQQIRDLTYSRNLFLRNIMHELKTPITKGVLITNMMEEGKFKLSLNRAFLRLEYLLNEFKKIEEFTSNNLKLKKRNFRIVDIIDNSFDILLTDKDSVQMDIQEDVVVNVDFELFSIAIKNLVDNCIKYSKEKPTITIVENTFMISSHGNKLSKSLDEYKKPFNKEFENSNSGLGLGLYIVQNILKAHDLVLEYHYQDGKNIFKITF